MKIAASRFGLLASMCRFASGADEPAPACNTTAISGTERTRYNDLVKKIRSSIRLRREIPDGYAFRLAEQSISVADVAEWIRMERLCCPFLVFQLEIAGPMAGLRLTLRGPTGTKALLDATFPDSARQE